MNDNPARRPRDGRRIASRIPLGQDHARGGAQSTQQTHTLKHPSQSKRSITSFSAQKFANTAWAFAMASQRDARLFATLARAAEQRLDDFGTQGLAISAWALSMAS